MTKTHQLEATLRSLKLGGMLDTIDARLTQAAAGELGHIEFLQVLCEDELTRRDAAGFIRRVREAHFESTTTIEEFDFAYNPKVPAAQMRLPRNCGHGLKRLVACGPTLTRSGWG
jgi:DNA replication protein DnaC